MYPSPVCVTLQQSEVYTEQILACRCQGWSWGCPREVEKELKEQWMSDVVCKVKSKWPRKKWESINGKVQVNKEEQERMTFLVVDASVSTSFTRMSHKWSIRMVLSQVLPPKFRNPDQCYSKGSKLTLRISIAFIFQPSPFTREKMVSVLSSRAQQ